ncbi:unnamed protein product, partial [Brenthis ino]
MQNMCAPNVTANKSVTAISDVQSSGLPVSEPTPGPSTSYLNFNITRPAAVHECFVNNIPRLNLGVVNTSFKEPKVPKANPEHLHRLEVLQRFGDIAWKDVRYNDVLKIHNAAPGFVEIQINDDLRQFIKGKDYVASSERLRAPLCNALISQREVLNHCLQKVIDWTALPDSTLSPSNIYDEISECFLPSSKFHKISEEIMQLVCGKRVEYFETRRERILSEISNKNLREGLRKIPPSSSFLFDETLLRSYIQNTGGSDKWLQPWFSSEKSQAVNSRKVPSKPVQHNFRDLSNQPFRQKASESSYRKNHSTSSFKQNTKSKQSQGKVNRRTKGQPDK